MGFRVSVWTGNLAIDVSLNDFAKVNLDPKQTQLPPLASLQAPAQPRPGHAGPPVLLVSRE